MALNIVIGVSGSGRTHFIENNFSSWKHFSVRDYQRKLCEEAGTPEFKSSPNLCVKYFFPGTSCAGDANASMSVHYHS